MGAVMMCIAVATLGIDVGWQRLPDGSGMEYLIQIEPQTLEALRAGQTIESDIPSNVNDIRSYRITVGTKKLPRDAPLATQSLRQPDPQSPQDTGPQREPAATMPPPFSTLPDTPSALSPDPVSKPLVQRSSATMETDKPATNMLSAPKQPAAPTESASSPAATTDVPKDVKESSAPTPSQPRTSLTLTLLGLFASVGLNVFLGWIVLDQRKRCHALLGRAAT